MLQDHDNASTESTAALPSMASARLSGAFGNCWKRR